MVPIEVTFVFGPTLFKNQGATSWWISIGRNGRNIITVLSHTADIIVYSAGVAFIHLHPVQDQPKRPISMRLRMGGTKSAAADPILPSEEGNSLHEESKSCSQFRRSDVEAVERWKQHWKQR